MSMTLKKHDKDELVRQLGLSSKAVKHKDSIVIVARPDGVKQAIVKVVENERGVFLYPYEKDNPLIKMARLVGSTMHEHSIEELLSELGKCTSQNIWLGWPEDGTQTVVGKMFCIGQGDTLTAYLWPVPVDIEEVNEQVRLICARKCKSAANGLQCGECECCGICETLKEADEEINRIKKGENK